jgi:hypothetical protein
MECAVPASYDELMRLVLTSLVIGLAVSGCLALDGETQCRLETLPVELQNRLNSDFAAWKMQEISDLGKSAKARWAAEKPQSCPGIAVGEFEIPNRTSYAVLLVPVGNPRAAYRLAVFTPSENNSTSILRIAESWDKGGASNKFIHTVRVNKVFSADWIRRLRVGTPEAILSVESAEGEYGTEVYFWADNRYHHEPIDY